MKNRRTRELAAEREEARQQDDTFFSWGGPGENVYDDDPHPKKNKRRTQEEVKPFRPLPPPTKKSKTKSDDKTFCQFCLKSDHWSYECKGERVYVSRPSATQRLLKAQKEAIKEMKAKKGQEASNAEQGTCNAIRTFSESHYHMDEFDRSLNHVLLIAGPAGVGKSTTVHAIASFIGADICEWNTPTPTIWQEHLHHSNSGLRYMSKLDEFESFVEWVRKFGILPSSVTARPLAPVVLLNDNLPVVNGKVTYERLKRCLTLLVQSVRIPTAMLFTDHSKADSTDFHMRYPEELLQSLESAGACKVTFNPITFNSMKKSLEKICKMEQVSVTADSMEAISKASGSDIRNAITSLQYFCLNQQSMPSQPSLSCYSTPSKESLDDANTSYNQISMTFGIDETISLFHALGKFLHNKRENEDTNSSDRGVFVLKEEFTRFPLKMDVPEVVLSQAHGQARPITDFLHENVLDFLNEEAADDAWVVSSYLRDADFLLSPSKNMIATNFGTENLQHLVAASVAVRGVLFGNNHPSPSRWHAIRRPKLWQVEQSMWQTKCQMTRERGHYYVDHQDQKSMPMQSVIATEIKPILKWLGHRVHGEFGIEQACEDMNENFVKSFSLGAKSDYDVSDDDIEDC